MHAFILGLAIGLAVGLPGGAYLWYRFGTRVKNDAAVIRTEVGKL